MRSKRVSNEYIRDMVEAVSDIAEFTQGITFETFVQDKMRVLAVRSCLTILGEAAKKVHPAIRRRYDNVPWKVLSDLRNKIVHEYFGIDHQAMWRAIQEDLPAAKPNLEIALNEVDAELFDKLRKGEV